MLPLQPFGQLLVSIITLWCGLHLFLLYREKKTVVVKDFFRFFLFFGLFFFFLSVPGLVSSFQPTIMGVGWIFGHFSLFIALAFFLRILLGIRHPRQRQWLFRGVLLLGLLLILLNALNFTPPLFINGIIDWNIHPLVGMLLAGVTTIIGVVGGAFFFRGALHTQDRAVIQRSVLMGCGIWLFVIAGGLLYFAAIKPEQPSMVLVGFGVLTELIGILSMFFSVQFFHRN